MVLCEQHRVTVRRMTTTTITETTLVDNLLCPDEDQTQAHYKMNHAKFYKSQYSFTDTSTYDSLVPKNDPKFLAPVRQWEKKCGFLTPLRWISITGITLYHIISVGWCLGYFFFGAPAKWQTIMFGFMVGAVAGFGVTAGAHRYWSHRSYKATKPLQVFLLLCYSVAGQNTVFEWVRDHRVHHKFSETSGDPHDANRGFFFSHMGWLMMKKHPEVIREGRKLDMSDITRDPLITLHTRYFGLLKILLCFILPTMVPMLCWGERWDYAIMSQPLLRYTLTLHFTWAVNSFAHLWGHKPYDKFIMPADNWGVSLVALGEGWHNYHHTFPWDYKASELAYCLNPTTLVLDAFAWLGWAYDRKQASPALVKAVIGNRGEKAKLC